MPKQVLVYVFLVIELWQWLSVLADAILTEVHLSLNFPLIHVAAYNCFRCVGYIDGRL